VECVQSKCMHAGDAQAAGRPSEDKFYFTLLTYKYCMNEHCREGRVVTAPTMPRAVGITALLLLVSGAAGQTIEIPCMDIQGCETYYEWLFVNVVIVSAVGMHTACEMGGGTHMCTHAQRETTHLCTRHTRIKTSPNTLVLARLPRTTCGDTLW
jgi:hypothetical protein